MKMAIREAKKTLRDFCVPACLVDSVDWTNLKSEIQVEQHMHDLIMTWLEICEII